ncbi:MAG: twin-arginine translocase subunit TatC [Actinobacteria bacterium]|nr:twin-arginine translocase subunit TatC [Actinomycetota bacterium]MCB9388740.1 twin-arginine translocase subunit TatC [Acidimicrobiia bacterium]
MVKAAQRDQAMSLVEHLVELRKRVIICAAAVVLGVFVSFLWLYDPFLNYLTEPYNNLTGKNLILLAPTDGFTLKMSICMYGGIALAFPVLMYQLWRFITPGLTERERNYAVPFVAASVLLFALGALLSQLVRDTTLDFLLTFGGDTFDPNLTAESYMVFSILMVLAFGICFEFPIILTFLMMAGVITPDHLSRWRRAAIVLIVSAAAIVTPSGDPFTLFVLAIPMYAFYEVVWIIGKIMKRRSRAS